MFGELLPVGGGDPIPLLKTPLLVGRSESCDVVLRFSNVSSQHCRLTLEGGYWYVQDMNSRNGIKVNGVRVQQKRLDPGDLLSVAKHKYSIDYSPSDNGAEGPPPPDMIENDIFGKSLLERAGLQSPRAAMSAERPEREPKYDKSGDASDPFPSRDDPV